MLSLKSNLVDFIELDSFNHLGKLKTLNLKKNKLEGIEIRLFDGLVCLQSIKIGHKVLENSGDDVKLHIEIHKISTV
jgi:hypothetical protein